MGEWREIPLGDLVKFSSGKTPSMSDPSLWGGQIPWISAKLMTDHKVKESSITITDKGLELGSKLAERGDILILVRGSGLFHDIPINWVEEPVAFNQDIKSVRAHDPELQEYIYYWLKSSKDYIYSILDTTGIGAGKFDTDLLRGLVVTMPVDADERRHLVETASALYAKIDLLHRQNKTLEGMAEALFRQWFVEEAREDWPWMQLGEHVEVLRGLSYTGAGLCEKDEGVPMHNLNSIYEGGGYKYDGIKYYKGEYKDRHIVLPGDVLVANTEQGHDQLLIGCPAIVPAYFGEAGIFSQHVYKLKHLNPAFSNVFVARLLLTPDVREQLTGSTNGSTVNMLPKDGIEMAKFQMPPTDMIKRFTAFAQPLQQKKESNYIQIQTLIAQRDTLLPKLMSGEVRVEQD